MRQASSYGENIRPKRKPRGERCGEAHLIKTMSPDELLFWLSARREGSWVQFRSAVEEILGEADLDAGDDGGIPRYQKMRFSLEQLGHVEFEGRNSEGGWRVAPPVLAVVQQPGGFLGIVCGARTPQLMSRFQDVAGSCCEVFASSAYPSVVRVFAAELGSLSGRASDAGLRFEPHAPVRILSCLSRVDQLPGSKPARLPFGRDFEVWRFAVERYGCKWMPSSDDAARGGDGLYRFVRFQVPEHYLKSGKRVLKVDGQTAKFFVLAGRRRQVLRYDRMNRLLLVPGICRPPLLVDRALVLCTGYLPAYEPRKRMLAYAGINEDIAGFAASLLSQNKL